MVDSEKAGLRIERNCKHTSEETSDSPANQTSEGAHQHAFLYSYKVESTIPQADYGGSPQTIRWFRRSDGKPVGLPIRLKELRTFSCFPLSQHRGFYFPPSASLSKEGNVWHASLRTAFAFLSFTQRKKCHMLPLLPGSDIQHSIFHLFSQKNIPFILAIPMRLTVSKI
mgnify:CR=1 FL=1